MGRAAEGQLEKRKKCFIGDSKEEECFQQCLGRGGQRFMWKWVNCLSAATKPFTLQGVSFYNILL